jgi:hypothetical protein
MPIILAIWEAKIRRMAVPGQPRQKSLGDSISTEKSWVWWHVPFILVTAGRIKWEDQGPGQPGHKVTPHLQNNQYKKARKYASSSRVPA